MLSKEGPKKVCFDTAKKHVIDGASEKKAVIRQYHTVSYNFDMIKIDVPSYSRPTRAPENVARGAWCCRWRVQKKL
jgi:hypothetical protein